MIDQLPTSAMGVIRQLSVSKSGVDMFCRQLISSVQNGEVNALELKAFLKTMELIIDRVDKETKENQVTEAMRYSEKKFSAYGCEIEQCEVSTRYDYSTCGDPIYNQRVKIAEEAKSQLDDRAAFLKALKEPLTIVDDESGEVATVRPPVKKSTSGLRITLK